MSPTSQDEPALAWMVPIFAAPAVGLISFLAWGMLGIAGGLCFTGASLLLLLAYRPNHGQLISLLVLSASFFIIGMSVVTLELTQ